MDGVVQWLAQLMDTKEWTQLLLPIVAPIVLVVIAYPYRKWKENRDERKKEEQQLRQYLRVLYKQAKDIQHFLNDKDVLDGVGPEDLDTLYAQSLIPLGKTMSDFAIDMRKSKRYKEQWNELEVAWERLRNAEPYSYFEVDENYLSVCDLSDVKEFFENWPLFYAQLEEWFNAL